MRPEIVQKQPDQGGEQRDRRPGTKRSAKGEHGWHQGQDGYSEIAEVREVLTRPGVAQELMPQKKIGRQAARRTDSLLKVVAAIVADALDGKTVAGDQQVEEHRGEGRDDQQRALYLVRIRGDEADAGADQGDLETDDLIFWLSSVSFRNSANKFHAA